MTRYLAVGILLISVVACDEGGRSPDPRFPVGDQGMDLGITLPRLAGWERDPDVELADPDQGGTALVLFRPNAPVGSPKITVDITGQAPQRLRLDAFLSQNLRNMGNLERETGMRITRVAQKPLTLGPRRAFFVRHEFTIGTDANQQALTQLAAIFIVDGRGITATAVGRTELFHPLSEQITRILTGIRISATSDTNKVVEVTPVEVNKPERVEPAPAKENQPVDLGTVGGR